jgi:hypothetical protein
MAWCRWAQWLCLKAGMIDGLIDGLIEGLIVQVMG